MTSRKIALMSDEQFGPEMNKLPIEKQIFVCMLFEHSGRSLTKAARAAGITSETYGGLRVKAHRLLREPQIKAALLEESKRRKVYLQPRVDAALARIVDNSQHPDHFKALKLISEQNGLAGVVQKVLDVNVNVTVTDEQKIERIRQFAIARGIDPATLLGFDPGKVEDAEYTDISCTVNKPEWENEDVSAFE